MIMAKEQQDPEKPEKEPHKITLPGWAMTEDEIGLGDFLKNAIYRVTKTPACPGCIKRAAALNRRFVLTRR
jgi:hypothetical protein